MSLTAISLGFNLYANCAALYLANTAFYFDMPYNLYSFKAFLWLFLASIFCLGDDNTIWAYPHWYSFPVDYNEEVDASPACLYHQGAHKSSLYKADKQVMLMLTPVWRRGRHFSQGRACWWAWLHILGVSSTGSGNGYDIGNDTSTRKCWAVDRGRQGKVWARATSCCGLGPGCLAHCSDKLEYNVHIMGFEMWEHITRAPHLCSTLWKYWKVRIR